MIQLTPTFGNILSASSPITPSTKAPPPVKISHSPLIILNSNYARLDDLLLKQIQLRGRVKSIKPLESKSIKEADAKKIPHQMLGSLRLSDNNAQFYAGYLAILKQNGINTPITNEQEAIEALAKGAPYAIWYKLITKLCQAVGMVIIRNDKCCTAIHEREIRVEGIQLQQVVEALDAYEKR